ncbi:universal stress protein [Halomonas vilamensis]|uniref:Universal stress protein n=1 Tax=Vreelandella vilamensis TaxID=531309 RepID=A0ABU1H3W8_9GAMM|nr:universal stress protein [Halomonas vilamensis]MDR5898521.1 universal stress protein [Halomonas vilamensis]
MFAHVLIGVDFSRAWPLLQQRLMRLRAKGVKKVTLISSISPKEIPHPSPDDIQRVRQRLEAEGEPLRDIGLSVTCLVETGKPSERLAALAQQYSPDLILLGCQGQGRWQNMLLGSTAQRLAHLSDIPLWLEPINDVLSSGSDFTTLVLATDGSPAALAADQMFQALSPHYQNHVALMAEALLVADGRGVEDAQLHLAVLEKRVPKLDTVIVFGEARHALIEEAKAWKADLVIIGKQGHSRLKERLLGSTAQALLEGVNCPVLVVPEKPHAY